METWTCAGPVGLVVPPLPTSVHSQPRPPGSELKEPVERGEEGVMLATGSCWRTASPPGLTGAPGSVPSKLGASGGAAPEPQRPLNQSPAVPLAPPGKNRLICHDPTGSCSPQCSLRDRARRVADAGEAELVGGKAQAWGGGGMRGREPGGFPPALPPPTGAENVICCAFQERFPGVTSPSRPGRGEQTKRLGRRRGDPAGR